jgi:DNA polymerase-4
MILHLRVVPGFWVAVEEVRRPEIRSQPIILCGPPQKQGVVHEASFAALQRGITPGMTLSQARQLCPESIVLLPDLPSYEVAWEAVCETLRRFTPAVEPVEMGQAASDLAGCERLWGTPREIAHAVSEEVRQQTGILPWLGIASNRLVAQLASTAEGITLIEPGRERAFLSDLPLALLPGIDARLALTFQVLGLRTIGQFAALPSASVKARFGAAGERLHALACGVDRRPVVPPPTRPSITVRRICDEGTIEEAIELLRSIAEECASELQSAGLAGTVVELTCEWDTAGSVQVLGTRQRPSVQKDGERPALEMKDEPVSDAGVPSPLLTDVSGGDPALPVPYRVHSMLPQPGEVSAIASTPVPVPSFTSSPQAARKQSHALDRVRTVVRTPVDTAARLMETVQRLLLQRWNQERRLTAMAVRVSEFPAPRQLSFIELDRIDQTGRLGGMSAERARVLAEGARVLNARYGDASFRHVAQVDPNAILSERRFRWEDGLPWRRS